MQRVSTILAFWCAALLSACGGGGGASTTPPDVPVVTVTFPLQAAYRARASAGYSEDFAVSGACSGTATLAAAKATALRVEDVDGFVSVQTSRVDLTDCAPANNVVTGNAHFDAKFTPIGSTLGTQEYARFASAPVELPVSVKVGDAGTLATLNTFTSSSKLVPTGRRTLSYGVEFDTATSAILVLTNRAFNTGDQLLSTQQARYRIDTVGALTLLSIEVQYSTSSTQRLLYTVKRAVPATTTFTLNSAYRARLIAGGTENFTVSGTCSGTATLVATVPASLTFEGIAGFSVTETNTLQLTNCSPSTLVLTEIAYLDSNYSPIGATQPGVDYARFSTAATPLPATVKVGDTGIIVSLNTFTDATKTVLTGRRDISYVIEPDTASTAVVNITSRSYNASGLPLLVQQTRYRMDATGNLVLVSIDAQYSTTSTIRLTYTSTRPFAGSQKFPLQQAYKARWLRGTSDRFVVSGTCNGTATQSESAPVASNFEGISVFATNQSALLNLTDCVPGTNAIEATGYYDTNAALLGVSAPGQYAKALGVASGWPAQVQVGDAGSVVTLATFTNNTQSVASGRKVVTYVVEPEALPASNSAIVNVITRTYNVSNQLLSTEQARYRIDAEGNLKIVSVEVQNSTTNTARLLYTLAPGVFTLVPAWPS